MTATTTTATTTISQITLERLVIPTVLAIYTYIAVGIYHRRYLLKCLLTRRKQRLLLRCCRHRLLRLPR